MKIKIGDNSLNLKAGGSMANIDRGPRGYSAYEVAVQEGFVGTEEEWLASLVGPEGPKGKDGERGLQGPIGPQGMPGKQGEKGKDGEDGEDGYTPVKGVDYFTPEDIESLNIPSKTSDIINDSGFITNSVNNLTNYTLKVNTGSLIDLSIDNTNYVVTLKLKNQDGTVISTDTIDLPLESVVVNGRYDNATKRVILTLENGSEVSFSVADLVAGLQSEITSQNKLASDLVDDTNSGNKFVTTSEKQAWDNKLDESDLADYVKNTDYAKLEGSAGVVKANGYYDIVPRSDGNLCGVNRNYNYYSNTSPVEALVSKGTLENVITGKGLVSNTDLVYDNNSGLVKSNYTYGYGAGNQYNKGTLMATVINFSDYGGTSNYAFIGKGTLENVIAGKGLVSDTDYATYEKGGTFRSANNVGTNSSGFIYATPRNYDYYNNTMDNYGFVSKGTLENVITGKELINQTTLNESQSVQDTNIEENASNIEELQSIVDQLPHETGEGTDIKLEPTIEAKMSIGKYGNSSQFSTTGKNLIPNNITDDTINGVTFKKNDDGSIKIIGTASARVEPNIYNNSSSPILFKAGVYRNTSSRLLVLYAGGYNSINANGTITLNEDKLVTRIYFRVESGEANLNETYYPQVIDNSVSDTSYEPYTGGIASPNPDYPQTVKSVTGENNIVVQNENLGYIKLTKQFLNYNSSLTPTNYQLITAGNDNYICYKTKVTPNTQYTIRALSFGNRGVLCGFKNEPQINDIADQFMRSNISSNLTFTTNNDINWILFFVCNDGIEPTEYMLVKGSTAPSTYVPHEEQNYQLSLGNIELNSSPDGTIRDGIYGSSEVSYNLLMNNATTTTINGITFTVNSDGSVTANGTATANANLDIGRNITNEFMGTYCCTGCPDNGSSSTYYVQKYKTENGSVSSLGSIYGKSSDTNIITLSNKCYLWLRLTIVSGYTANNLIFKPMITEGSEVKPYFPYGQVGMWWKREIIKKVVITNDTIITKIPDIRYNIKDDIDYYFPGNISQPGAISNCYISRYNSINGSILSSSTYNAVSVYDDRFESVDDFRAWAIPNLNIYRILSTAREIPITDTTLINQLNNIYENAHSCKGTTNITSTYEDGNEQMYLDASALMDIGKKLESLGGI